MEDTQRIRLLILGLSGLLLVGGGVGWVWYNNSKTTEEPTAESSGATPSVPTAGIRNLPPKRPLAVNTGAAGAPNTGAPAGKPPAIGTTPPGQPQTIPATAARPGQSATARPGSIATVPPAAVPSQGSGHAPGALPQIPSGSNTGLNNKTPAQAITAFRPGAATSPPPGPNLAHGTNTPFRPAAQAVAGAGNTTARSPQMEQVNPPAPTTPEQSAPTAKGKTFPSTTLAAATLDARSGSGRTDPAQPVIGYLPFPRPKNVEMPTAHLAEPPKIASGGPKLVPPPPPKIDEKLVPPPPPPSDMPSPGMANAGDSGLPLNQLPEPPSKPTIGDKMKLLAVMDNRAIMTFPAMMTMKNKWPKTISLGAGEQFESVSVVAVNKDGVTIEEDGERSVKALEPVK